MNDYDIFGLQPIFIITIFSSDEAILHLTKANFPPATWSSFKNIAKILIKCLIGQKSQRQLFEGSKGICHFHCLCLDENFHLLDPEGYFVRKRIFITISATLSTSMSIIIPATWSTFLCIIPISFARFWFCLQGFESITVNMQNS